MKNEIIQVHDLQFESWIKEGEILKRVSELAATLSEKYKRKDPLFISVLNGGYIFTADLLRAYGDPCEVAFVRLASYKGTKSSGRVKILKELFVDPSDRHVIIVEDIIDTGKTMDYMIKYLSSFEIKSVEIVTLFFKSSVFRGKHVPDYVGFDIENRFILGYGMDYDELGRNLRDIYVERS